VQLFQLYRTYARALSRETSLRRPEGTCRSGLAFEAQIGIETAADDDDDDDGDGVTESFEYRTISLQATSKIPYRTPACFLQ